MSSDKFDIKKTQKNLYSAGREFELAEVPQLRYLAVDGSGDPNTSPEYTAALGALYGVAYAVKFGSKNSLGRDFVVGPLEGLWRSDDLTAFVRGDKGSWDWTMMISQPDWITDEMVSAGAAQAAAKKDLPALGKLELRSLTEGTSVQILHIGPYDEEGPTLARLHQGYMPENGLAFNGDHHEIYLSDPRRSAPESLKTILRQPVKRVQGDFPD